MDFNSSTKWGAKPGVQVNGNVRWKGRRLNVDRVGRMNIDRVGRMNVGQHG